MCVTLVTVDTIGSAVLPQGVCKMMIQDPSDPTIRQLEDLNGEKERPKRKGQDIRFTDNEERYIFECQQPERIQQRCQFENMLAGVKKEIA